MRSVQYCFAIAFLLFTVLPGCSKKDDPVAPPATGLLGGRVTDATSSGGLSSVRITVINAMTNDPVGTYSTMADGAYVLELPPGSYYLRFARQGYEPIPPADVAPMPVGVSIATTTTNSVQMFRSSVTNGGAISGKVSAAGKPVAGALVVAASASANVSGLTDAAGDYVIYNLLPGTYRLKAWVGGYTSSQANPTVTTGTELTSINLTLIQDQMAAVSGRITFLATTNAEVDVALLNPDTREVVPGLTTLTSGGTYTIANVPSGTYLARATYRNDTKVMDPDWIAKNGEPSVIVTAASTTRDFSVTGAITLVGPGNTATTTQPAEVSTAGLTFTWSAYASADDYVVEVTNQSGRVIWGGFADNWTVRKVLLPKTQTSCLFNSDGKATEQLMTGKVYRWKVYASKNDSQDPLGWKLISASEDQQGLIRIVQ